jgi:peptidoglycan/xylan/chitin deacetylase (PgdA/CDA1 family)
MIPVIAILLFKLCFSALSPDNTCGFNEGRDTGFVCPNNECCSQYGWCGSGTDYCTNCQAIGGFCPSSPSPPPTTGFPISSDGFCGPIAGTQCPTGQCCSDNGRCGTSVKFCGIVRWSCRLPFGKCGGPAPIPSLGSFPTISASLKAPVVLQCKQPGQFALTYDDGVYDYTDRLLTILKNNNVRATFFVNAYNYGDIIAEPNVSILKRMDAEGHQIASHTYDHLDIATLNTDQLWAQMYRNDFAIKQILGVRPTYFRPPFGSYNDANLIALGSWGYKVIWKNIDNFDTQHAGAPDAMQRNQAAYDQDWADSNPSSSSFISLQHDTLIETVEQWTQIAIDQVKRRGYTFVTVGECNGEPNPQSWYRD